MNELLFDSRLSELNRSRFQVVGPDGLYYEKVFCPSCGKRRGAQRGFASIWATCEDCAKYELPVHCETCHTLAPAMTPRPPEGQIYVCPPCFERGTYIAVPGTEGF